MPTIFKEDGWAASARNRGAEHGDSLADLRDVIGGRLVRADAGDRAAVLLQVLAHLNRIEGDGAVEEGEAEDHQGEDEQIPQPLWSIEPDPTTWPRRNWA